ncbi:MAG: hypothetical protein QOG63_191 [Thermoleophilaceae bacterium]|jgi:hypothetical protein|nr:hypothetical protein [Thermoleophilaceae bacterium]
MRHVLVASTVAAAAVLPASAAAALPLAHGVFWNGSHKNGVSFDTSRHSVRDLQFFCKETRYDLERPVTVHRDGRFTFSGRLRRYGGEGQPLGIFHGKVRGRFLSAKRVRMRRTLGGCGTATVRASGKSA